MEKGRPFELGKYDIKRIVKLSYIRGWHKPRDYKHISVLLDYNYRNMIGWVRYNCIETRNLEIIRGKTGNEPYDVKLIVKLSYKEGINKPLSYEKVAELAGYNCKNMLSWIRHNCIETRNLKYKERT